MLTTEKRPLIFFATLSCAACAVATSPPVDPGPPPAEDAGLTPDGSKPAPKSDGGLDGGDGSAPDAALGPCEGWAMSNGEVDNVVPEVHVGIAALDSSQTSVDIQLSPNATVSPGDVLVGLAFAPKQGQLSYVKSPFGGCGVVDATGSGSTAVATTQGCDIELSVLQFASAPGTCDGRVAGTYDAVFSHFDSPSEQLIGSFDLPLDVASSELVAPACVNPGNTCSSNSDCCSYSCSQFYGTCN